MALKSYIKSIILISSITLLIILFINADTTTQATTYNPSGSESTINTVIEEKTPEINDLSDQSSTETEQNTIETELPVEKEADTISSATDYPGNNEELVKLKEEEPYTELSEEIIPEETTDLTPEEDKITEISKEPAETEKIAEEKPVITKEKQADAITSATAIRDDMAKSIKIKIDLSENDVTSDVMIEEKLPEKEKKIAEIEEVIEEKEEEKSVDLKKSDVPEDTANIIELSDSEELVYIQQVKEDFEMILFDRDVEDNLPPSSRLNYREERINNLKTDYQLKGFRPETLEDFFRAEPVFQYDKNGVIRPGEHELPGPVGDKLLNSAFNFIKKQETKNALNILKRLVHYNSHIAESLYLLGFNYIQNKNDTLALAYIKKAVEYLGEDENKLRARYLDKIGNLYYNQEDFNNAEYYFKESLKLQINSEIYLKMGMIYYNLGNYDDSLSFWNKGADLGNTDCRENYNWLQKKLKK